MGLSFSGSVAIHLSIGAGIPASLGYGCIAVFKNLADACTQTKLKNWNWEEKIFQKLGIQNQTLKILCKRLVIDYGVSAVAMSVFRPSKPTPAVYLLVLHAFSAFLLESNDKFKPAPYL